MAQVRADASLYEHVEAMSAEERMEEIRVAAREARQYWHPEAGLKHTRATAAYRKSVSDPLVLIEILDHAAAVEADLRREWWINHGHDYFALYGDDGEMQCSICLCDFKRAPLDEVREVMRNARLVRAAAAYEQMQAESKSE